MVDRRQVIAGGTALALSAVAAPAFAAPASHVRLPIHKFVQDETRVEAFKRGVAVMQGRKDPTDPTSWAFQASVHWVRDAVITDWATSFPKAPTLVGAGFWQQCPHDGQGSANFLLWHRAYLYYFERILRDAAKDETLTLPYWDYSDRSQDGTADSFSKLPAIFAPEGMPVAWPNANPLAFKFRRPSINDRTGELSAAATNASLALAQPDFFGADETSGFCGADLDADLYTRSKLEETPHGDVHGGLGPSGAKPGEKGMGSVPEAAFDPIFWVHHANIDRLWVRYVSQAGKAWGALPDAKWFSDTPWSFYDYDGSVQSKPRSYWMDIEALDYSYDGETAAQLTWPPSGPTAAPPSPLRESEELFRSGPIRLTATEGAKVDLPAETSAAVAAVAERAVTMANGSAPALLLKLENPRFDGVPDVSFAVLINPTEAERADPALGSAVATFSMFSLGMMADMAGDTDTPMNMDMPTETGVPAVTVDITTAIARRGGSAVSIEVLPYALVSPSEAGGGLLMFDALRIVEAARSGLPTS